MNGFQDTIFALAILAAGILAWFGARLVKVPETRTKGVLMVIMALVLVGNVLVWTL